MSWCEQDILSSTYPIHLSVGSYLLLGITSAILGRMDTHNEPNLETPQPWVHAALQFMKGSLTHEAYTHNAPIVPIQASPGIPALIGFS